MRALIATLALAFASTAALAGDTAPAADTSAAAATAATEVTATAPATGDTATIKVDESGDAMSYGFGGCHHDRQSHAEALIN